MMSPFEHAYGIDYSEGDFSLERIPYTYTPSADDITHTVMEDETILSIAFDYYGDSGLWGVIADTNNLSDVSEEVVPGLKLIIPNGRN